MDSVTYLRQFESCDDIGNGDFSRIYQIADEYAALQAESERLKAERVDLEQFREPLVALSDYAYERHGDADHPHCLDADRLLALIDAHKGE